MASVKENKKLDDFFSVISLSLDKSGNAYVSTMEAKEYPFVATQVRRSFEVKVRTKLNDFSSVNSLRLDKSGNACVSMTLVILEGTRAAPLWPLR